MHDILRNLYYVSLIAMLLQFAGLYEPFNVIFGLTLLFLAAAELFMSDEIDRLRRMNSFSYRRRADVSAAFVLMTLCFGLYHLASGLHFAPVYGQLGRQLLGAGSLAALYVFIRPYLPTDRGDRRRGNLRPL